MCSWRFYGVRMRSFGRLESDLRKYMDTNTPGDLVPSGVLVLAEDFAFLLKSGRFNTFRLRKLETSVRTGSTRKAGNLLIGGMLCA